MNVTKLILFVLALAICSQPSAAERRDLLSEPDAATRDRSVQANDYFLKKHLYEARQHKIVHVNVGVLRGNEPFTLSFFDGYSINVYPVSLEEKYSGRVLRFKGRIVRPGFSTEDLLDEMPLDAAEALSDQLTGISIIGALYQYEEETDQNVPYFSTRTPDKDGSNTIGGGGQPPSEGQRFYGFSMQFFDLATRTEYVLHNLEMGGREHVLIEVDPDKKVEPGSHEDSRNPEMAQKRRDKAAYFESLGEDPRITRERDEIMQRLEERGEK